jgi:pimeloyl-ACP methyl ester carboxylesterase
MSVWKEKNTMSNELVEQFCTPPLLIETEADKKLINDAAVEIFPFEGINLKGYSWGTGRNVLLVHGWGSRASHMAFIARTLAKNGFHVLAYDGPAHGYSLKVGGANTSNFFEFCRAIKHVADSLNPLYAVVGHSLGSTAAAVTVAGHERLDSYKITPERLVLISPLAGVTRMVDHFCRRNGLPDKVTELLKALESEFHFSADQFHLPGIMNKIASKLLIIHDEDDVEVPVTDAISLKAASPNAEILLTKGSGHERILVNRDVLRRIKEFLI